MQEAAPGKLAPVMMNAPRPPPACDRCLRPPLKRISSAALTHARAQHPSTRENASHARADLVFSFFRRLGERAVVPLRAAFRSSRARVRFSRSQRPKTARIEFLANPRRGTESDRPRRRPTRLCGALQSCRGRVFYSDVGFLLFFLARWLGCRSSSLQKPNRLLMQYYHRSNRKVVTALATSTSSTLAKQAIKEHRHVVGNRKSQKAQQRTTTTPRSLARASQSKASRLLVPHSVKTRAAEHPPPRAAPTNPRARANLHFRRPSSSVVSASAFCPFVRRIDALCDQSAPSVSRPSTRAGHDNATCQARHHRHACPPPYLLPQHIQHPLPQ